MDNPITDEAALEALRVLRRYFTPPPSTPVVAYYDREHLPPGINTARVFAARCRSIQGARREGRHWVVSAAAWEAARANVARAPDESPAAILAAAGVPLRALAGGRR